MEPAGGLSDALMPPEGEAGALHQRQPLWPWGLAGGSSSGPVGRGDAEVVVHPGESGYKGGEGAMARKCPLGEPFRADGLSAGLATGSWRPLPPRACTECPRGPRPANPGHMTVVGEAFCTRIGPAGSFLPFLAGVLAVCVRSRGKLPWPQVPSTPSPGEAAPLLSAAAHPAHRPGLSGGQRLSEALPKRPLPAGPAAPARPPCPACGAPLPRLRPCQGQHLGLGRPPPGVQTTRGRPDTGAVVTLGAGGQQAGGFQGVGLLPGTHADNTGSLGTRGRAVRRPS